MTRVYTNPKALASKFSQKLSAYTPEYMVSIDFTVSERLPSTAV